MPARNPAEWLKLYFVRTGTLPLPASKMAKAIVQSAADVRQEALLECYEACLQYFRDDGSAQKCAKDIQEMIRENMMRMGEEPLWDPGTFKIHECPEYQKCLNQINKAVNEGKNVYLTWTDPESGHIESCPMGNLINAK